MSLPALALLELASVAEGIRVADRMVKSAPIALLKAGTVHPGHYLVLIGGTVASVEEAWTSGRSVERSFLLDEVFLPDVHEEVLEGVLGRRQELLREALGVFETRRVAPLLRASDAAVKGADVRIAELRIADDLGGRAFVLFDGRLTEVQAALEIGASRVAEEQILHAACLPRLDADLRRLLDTTTRFAACASFQPEGAERP